MSNVSYELLRYNRKVRIQINQYNKVMLYRDFRKLLDTIGYKLSDDDSLIIGFGKTLEVQIDTIH